MIGAIIGDIIGSIYEFNSVKTKDFTLFRSSSRPTDDSIMTLAVAKSLLDADGDYDGLSALAVSNMQSMGRRYIEAGYGGSFRSWLLSPDPQPYNSFGNGASMRISPVAHVASSIDEVVTLSDKVTSVTHNHPEGIKGARAVASAIYLAKVGKSKEYIERYISDNYYDLDYDLDDIRSDYTFHVDSMQSVGESIKCFTSSDSFEDAIRNAVSLGGDADTMADMAGAIAEVYYGVPQNLYNNATQYLDKYLMEILTKFEEKYGNYIDRE